MVPSSTLASGGRHDLLASGDLRSTGSTTPCSASCGSRRRWGCSTATRRRRPRSTRSGSADAPGAGPRGGRRGDGGAARRPGGAPAPQHRARARRRCGGGRRRAPLRRVDHRVDGRGRADHPGTTLTDGLREHLGDRLLVSGATAEDPAALADTEAELGIVVVHEPPYAEGLGDRSSLALDPAQVALVAAVADRVERTVLVVVSGRPLVLGEVLELTSTPWSPRGGRAARQPASRTCSPGSGPRRDGCPSTGRMATSSSTRPRPSARLWVRGHGLTTAPTSAR
jgi:hypothetical protein